VEYGGTGCPIGEGNDHKGLLAIPQEWKDNVPPVTAPGLQKSASSNMMVAKEPSGKTPMKSEKGSNNIGSSSPWNWLMGKKKKSSSEAFLGEKNRYVLFLLLLC
jgi:hypothetical protein